ncbi:MAG: FAD-dependent oxidoreductase [Candidatus Cloacimonadales bacterium]|jgi:dihydrolipoamide dehydrogenase|nr:FAD-dependent oxidoreductase [Candidatus Cloacimonadota bacterium]MDY0381966.1 FAD-dependent oxidoreductase [Candidatus Cloacimonadaceae bacterium]MCB5257168.1 FAD-dependent oxidoreductase [Candidatus Cloacimonadota bacterium]MCB5276518.1 FAD-dependent oxidoreductase [Candidatus Cloacimonadota bacterium]MCK9434698.1 FAD-dependent oxidoreductase [Candidatus Cloacimonadota bacterium]
MIYDLIIIGSGPAGYVAAIKAGQRGLKTLVIDKKYVGGMCLNWGCIPTKSILESAKMLQKVRSAADFGISGIDTATLSFDWQQAVKRTQQIVSKLSRGIEFLWKKNGVEFLKAEAKILSPTQVEADKRVFETKNILIATGSRPAPRQDFVEALNLEELYSLESLPEKPLLVGRGANLVELAQFFNMIGKEPIILADELPLMPSLDSYLESFIQKKLKKDKIPLIPIAEATIKDKSIVFKDKEYPFDMAINVSFRDAVLPETVPDITLEKGFIKTDRFHQSSIPGIYAAGDVNGKSYLAHVASAQALEVIDTIMKVELPREDRSYPLNIYSEPEMAQIGMTEEQIKAAGIDYKVNQYSLNANGKALAEGTSEGFIRILYETKYHEVLGVQMVSEHATDLISEAGILMELEGTTFDLARTIHAHPTVAEVYMDAGSIE